MTKQTALAEVTTPNVDEFDDQTVTITMASDFNYIVDQTYLVVPKDTQGRIRLVINANLDKSSVVRFDIPAVSFIGAQPHAMVNRLSDTEVVMDWVNDEGYQGRSFFYRIHMVGQRTLQDGTVLLTAISHDPTIHNDPPS